MPKPAPQTAPKGESWHGVIDEPAGASVTLSLRPEPGADGSVRSVLLLPRPTGDGYTFAGQGPSQGWPAGTLLSGGASLEVHAPVLQDLVVSLLADGLPVASATYTAPFVDGPTAGPRHFALPETLEQPIPPGALLALQVEVAATADVVLHATQAHPTGFVLGSLAEAGSPAPQGVQGRLVVQSPGNLPPCAGSPDTSLMVPCEWVLGGERWFRQETNGTVVGFNLTLTWEAASPLTETLFLGFGPVTSEGDVDTFTAEARAVQGTSPLTLSVEGLNWPAGRHAVSVWWSGAIAGGPAQPFQVDGEILWA